MFIEREDYKVVIGDSALKALSQADPDNVANAETEAIEEVAGYLRPVYDTDAIFSAVGDQRNKLLVMYTVDIVLYHLSASMPGRFASEIRKPRYDRAIRWLEGIQSGRIVPTLPKAPCSDASGPIGLSFDSMSKLRHQW